MQLAELQQHYRKTSASSMEKDARIERLQLQLKEANELADDFQVMAQKRGRQVNELLSKQREMVAFICKTREFQSFIIERTWKQDASDLDMVMAFLASMPEVK